MIIIKISSKLKNDNPLPCSIHIEDFFLCSSKWKMKFTLIIIIFIKIKSGALSIFSCFYQDFL